MFCRITVQTVWARAFSFSFNIWESSASSINERYVLCVWYLLILPYLTNINDRISSSSSGSAALSLDSGSLKVKVQDPDVDKINSCLVSNNISKHKLFPKFPSSYNCTLWIWSREAKEKNFWSEKIQFRNTAPWHVYMACFTVSCGIVPLILADIRAVLSYEPGAKPGLRGPQEPPGR